jgi:hypothetical protein
VEREIMLLKILITQMSGRLEKEYILVTRIHGDHEIPSRKTRD